MPHAPDERIADDRRAPTDSGLRCPQCDYNLTGLTEKRCPECGSAFDPEELREILAGRPGPIPGWDDRYRSTWIVGLARACRLMWFRPTEFAQPFSVDVRPAIGCVLLDTVTRRSRRRIGDRSGSGRRRDDRFLAARRFRGDADTPDIVVRVRRVAGV